MLEQVGSPSEVFIRRHIDCFGGRSTVVARRPAARSDRSWGGDFDVPVLPALGLVGKATGQARSLLRTGRRHAIRETTRRQRQALVALLRSRGVDVVLAEYLDKWLPFVDDMVRAGLRVYGHGHGYDVSRRLREPYWPRAYRRWNKADGVIVPSRRMRRRLVGIGLDGSRIHVIPYGVEVPAATTRTRERNAGYRYLAVGRLVTKKAPLLTLEAFDLVRRDHGDARLDLVGDGPLLEEVEAFVAERALGPSVTLWGAQPHDVVRQLFNQADVFVQHSRIDPATGDEEGLPVAILEAMAHALPVVATRHAGIPESVLEGETGLLVDEGDVRGMAAAMEALAADVPRARSLGEAGRRRAIAEFSLERQCARLTELLV